MRVASRLIAGTCSSPKQPGGSDPVRLTDCGNGPRTLPPVARAARAGQMEAGTHGRARDLGGPNYRARVFYRPRLAARQDASG